MHRPIVFLRPLGLRLLAFILKAVGVFFLDAILSGDNAVVIALAAKNLDPKQQKQAIYGGTVGAVICRVLLLLAISWVIKIPYLSAVAGLVLVFIAFKLLKEDEGGDEMEAKPSLWSAIGAIIVADLSMSIDNVAAVVGVAGGNFPVMVFGVLVSIAFVMFASQLIIKLMEKFPWIIVIGSALIIYCAGGMIVEDHSLAKLVKPFFELDSLRYILPGFLTVICLIVGFVLQAKSKKSETEAA